MTKTYTVLLPIEVDGKIHQHGSVIPLDDETARLYSHALRETEPETVKEKTADGGNS